MRTISELEETTGVLWNGFPIWAQSCSLKQSQIWIPSHPSNKMMRKPPMRRCSKNRMARLIGISHPQKYLQSDPQCVNPNRTRTPYFESNHSRIWSATPVEGSGTPGSVPGGRSESSSQLVLEPCFSKSELPGKKRGPAQNLIQRGTNLRW